jgi:hypothetical protein
MNSFGRDRPLLSLACQALTTKRSWIRCIKLQCEAETCTHILPRFELWYGFPANGPRSGRPSASSPIQNEASFDLSQRCLCWHWRIGNRLAILFILDSFPEALLAGF